MDDNKKIGCFFAPNISLAYVGYIEKMRNNQKYMESRITRQWHYCNNYFVKSEKKMKEHLACCSGKAGFTFSFDNGKVIDYQDHFSNLGELLFAIYFDFETTANVVFFDAKMYVVSYSIVVAFYPDFSLPRINIFRSYDQSFSSIMPLAHFYVLDFIFFDDHKINNKKTLKQLQVAALPVNQKEKNTALAEMFSVKLKFTTDTLKSWFQKWKVLELDLDQKVEFIRKNPLKKDILCCLCDFPINARAKSGWFDHVIKAEYLFLENIYISDDLKEMKIERIELFEQKIKNFFEYLDDFCASIEPEYKDDQDLEIVSELRKIKTSKEDDGKATKEKPFQYLYEHSIKFVPTAKIKNPILSKFSNSMIAIYRNQMDIHHSHTTRKIIGYAHNFCNLRCKENY